MAIGAWMLLSTVPGVAVRTLFRHYFRYSKQVEESEARSELTFDEAFWIAKEFIEKAMSYTVEDAQSFCNTHVPHPPWVNVVPVVIPPETCVIAARVLVEHLGEEECRRVAGGQTWWQRRARADGGVEAEWISMRKDWDGEDMRGDTDTKGKKKVSTPDTPQPKRERYIPPQYTSDMDESPRTMLYIHGGAHYLGSLNTHRYAIWRYARKMGGRAFGVTYRLSPQYPWPCALQDCLASYLYLIRPPPNAKHAPVDPKRIILAGDSAGGGLVLSLLCIIRDMRLPVPACGVLISPWVDLTHSFPSILQNTGTDIIPPSGFIHRPSVLWPPPDSDARSKIDAAMLDIERNQIPEDLRQALERGKKAKGKQRMATNSSSLGNTPVYTSGTNTPVEPLTTQEGGWKHLDSDKAETDQPSELKPGTQEVKEERAEKKDDGGHPSQSMKGKPVKEGATAEEVNEGDRAEPAPVLTIKVDGKPVELKEQIQLYATNAQLTHPLVSPALQPSLGGLPPLLIIAGDKEVLRDEIIYVAHKAAHPERYPLRKELLKKQPTRAKLAAHYKPTEVHLQVYDGACHVIPMFSFTTPAKYCFRSIASFCVANTTAREDKPLTLTDSPDDEHAPTSLPNGHAASSSTPPRRRASTGNTAANSSERHNGARTGSPEPEPQDKPDLKIKTMDNGHEGNILHKSRSYGPNRRLTRYFTTSRSPDTRSPHSSASFSDPRKKTMKKKDLKRLGVTIYTETKPFNRPDYEDHMIRERVATNGKVRELEKESELAALQLPADDIGLVKEGPVKRYLEGKAIWDKRYAKTYEKIKRERAKHLREAQRDEASRLRQRLHSITRHHSVKEDAKNRAEAGVSDLLPSDRGVWDLGDEQPPPSSIAARKDIGEALRLAKVVDEQRESLSHPMALWNEARDLTWLMRDSKVKPNDEPDQDSSTAPEEKKEPA